MKLFIDTANVEEIKLANELGVICGVTTNPSLIAKEGRDFKQVVTEITEIVDGPISAEVISLECDGMVSEARELAKIHKNIVIKIPMTLEGLKAVKILTAEGIHTNVTLIFSAAQALPMPTDAPVITAVLFLNPCVYLLFKQNYSIVYCIKQGKFYQKRGQYYQKMRTLKSAFL